MTHCFSRPSKYFLLPALLLAAFLTWRCGSGTTTVLGPANQLRCGVTLSPATTSIGAAGGSGTLDLTTDRECQWSIVLAASWLSVTSGTSGQGPTRIAYTVNPNQSASPRTTQVSIGDQRVSISQQGAACTFVVAPTSAAISAAGGQTRVTIATDAACSWEVESAPDWIAAEPHTGTGPAEITLDIHANPGAQRTGTVVMGGQSVTITQSATAPCAPVLNPTLLTNLPATGATVAVSITMPANCAWSVAGLPSWIGANPAAGTGSGSASLIIQANTGGPRNASLTIAGQTFTVSQVGAPAAGCSFTLNPTSLANVPAGGTTSMVAITTTAGCAWSVSSLPAWISANPTSGTGAGSVSLTIQANSGGPRNVDLTIAGMTFSVSQNAGAGCSFTLNPTSLTNVPGIGVLLAPVAVATTTGCAWSVSGLPIWITALPTSGVGPGTVTLTVLLNVGGNRNANITIAGKTFMVMQNGLNCQYDLNPNDLKDVAAAGDTRSVAIATTAGCPWSVTNLPTNPQWITAAPTSGTGPGSITLTILPQPAAPAPKRNTDIQIAGKNFNVSQVAR